MPTTPATGTRSAGALRLVGALGTGAGLVGAVHAALLATWPPAVDEGSYSHPFDAGGFAVSQAVLTARDLVLAALLAALLRTAVGRTRVARVGLVSSAVSMLVLACLEVASVAMGGSADLGAWYGLASFGVGLGLVVAGTSAARTPLDSPWLRFLPLAIGVYVFAVLTPGILAGFAAGQVVISGWMVLFARLGWELARGRVGPRRSSRGREATR
ncbi:hypothetical protein HN031_19655 [Nocardioides sp. zg-1308]|uniref:hypothetical protein n=1 Tax=Nocardioides sp. zg-1308 TaxID=2736253 RepID=UPI001555ED57|nr:hypothetical protein [Nocardioides sp. zg-1308]NPD06896.1 hypothetical protein [Nocardioides sp. zg-1308]